MGDAGEIAVMQHVQNVKDEDIAGSFGEQQTCEVEICQLDGSRAVDEGGAVLLEGGDSSDAILAQQASVSSLVGGPQEEARQSMGFQGSELLYSSCVERAGLRGRTLVIVSQKGFAY